MKPPDVLPIPVRKKMMIPQILQLQPLRHSWADSGNLNHLHWYNQEAGAERMLTVSMQKKMNFLKHPEP